jgi:hypothetical protein
MNKNKEFYLDDYSMEDILKNFTYNQDDNQDNNQDYDSQDSNQENDNNKDTCDKPSFTMKPNYNSKGEKVVVFSINIPLKKNGLKIDILINNEMYKNMGKHLK